MEPQPLDQARNNAYALRRRIRAFHPTLANVRVEYGASRAVMSLAVIGPPTVGDRLDITDRI